MKKTNLIITLVVCAFIAVSCKNETTTTTADENQKTELLGNEAWAAEAKQLFDQVLDLTLTTRGKKWKSI